MNKELKSRLLKPLYKRTMRNKKINLIKSLEKLDFLAAETDKISDLKKNIEHHKSPREWIDLARTLHLSGRITRPTYIFYVSAHIESIRDDRWLKDVYAEKLKPISNQMRQIESSHGLEKGEYWPISNAPPSYKKLDRIYNSILNEYLHDLYIEFELYDIAEMIRNNKKEYDKLREQGRRACFHKDETVLALKDVIVRYEKEAHLASSVKAYSAAITLLGASLEGLLLLRCLSSKRKSVNIAEKLPRSKRPRFTNNPITWTFDNLIEVCTVAGWLSSIETSFAQYDSANLAHFLRQMRNHVHPGKIITERPWTEICKNEYENAEAFYVALYSKIGSRLKNWSLKTKHK